MSTPVSITTWEVQRYFPGNRESAPFHHPGHWGQMGNVHYSHEAALTALQFWEDQGLADHSHQIVECTYTRRITDRTGPEVPE